MTTIIEPAFGDIIIEGGGGSGAATQYFQNWMESITQAVNDLQPLTGTSTPEGSVTASVGRWFVDTSTGDVYFKATGDGDTGWLITT
jgi:hypothetical protein